MGEEEEENWKIENNTLTPCFSVYTCISGAKFGSILGKINWAAIYTVVETFLLLRSQIWDDPEGCCFRVISLIVTRPGGEVSPPGFQLF